MGSNLKQPVHNARKHRHKTEMRMEEFFPVTFVHDSDEFTAQLTNVSMCGAHLLVSDSDLQRHDLPIGEELHLDVRTPYGNSQCSATIAWFDPEASPLSIGVEFTSLSKDRSDPLRCAMDSAL
jgi:hypothetical protein